MTTFTDEDKELIKEIRERIGSLDVRDNIERRAYEIALASLEAEAVMFCISGQNVDSEEHVSTSKAVVDAWLKNGIRLTELLASHCTKLCHSTITPYCQRQDW